jgi:hypothetical protein
MKQSPDKTDYHRATQLLAQEFDLSVIQPHSPGDGPNQRCLAGAIRTQQKPPRGPKRALNWGFFVLLFV